MKQTQKTLLLVAAVVLAIGAGKLAFADLDAAAIVSTFNALNGGVGLKTTNSSANGAVTLNPYSGSQFPSISAYVASARSTSGTGFQSFCLEPSAPGPSSGSTGKLNFNSVTGTSTTSSNNVLSIGAATLYAQFATGTLSNYSYTSADASLLLTAIRAAMGISTVTNWTTNKYLNQLLAVNANQSYWQSAYDARQTYGFGDYSVFVININLPSGGNAQDFLYIAQANNTGGGDGSVPEPASILLWSLGGLGGLIASWKRKQKRNKQVCLS